MVNKILILLTAILLTSNFCFGNIDSFKSFWLRYDSLTVFEQYESENFLDIPLALDQRRFDFTHPLVNYVQTDSIIFGIVLGDHEFEPSFFMWFEKDLFWFKIVSGGKYDTHELFFKSIDRLYYLNGSDCIAIEIYFNFFIPSNLYSDGRIYDRIEGIIYKKEFKFLKESYIIINNNKVDLDGLKGLLKSVQAFKKYVPNNHVNYNPKYISFRLLNMCSW